MHSEKQIRTGVRRQKENQTSQGLPPTFQTMARARAFNPIIPSCNEFPRLLPRHVFMILPRQIQLKVRRGTTGPLDRMVQDIFDHMRVIVGR